MVEFGDRDHASGVFESLPRGSDPNKRVFSRVFEWCRKEIYYM